MLFVYGRTPVPARESSSPIVSILIFEIIPKSNNLIIFLPYNSLDDLINNGQCVYKKVWHKTLGILLRIYQWPPQNNEDDSWNQAHRVSSPVELSRTACRTASATAAASVQSNEASSVEDDDTLSYFSKLAEDE